MTSSEAGTPAGSTDAKNTEEITPANTTEPDGKRQEPGEVSQQQAPAGNDSAPPAEHHEDTPRRLSHKVGAVILHQSKRRSAALIATVTATTGLIAGWMIRRDRARKPFWRRRGR